MTPFHQSLTALRSLVFAQRSARLLLRALWTGLAGYLIAWGTNSLWGLFPVGWARLALGLGFALPSLFALLRPLPVGRLAWRLDRLFGLKEQITTAWQTANLRRVGGSQVDALLLEDATRLLPAQRARVLRRGWFLGQDAESLAIVLLLAAAVFFFSLFNNLLSLPDAHTQELPPLNLPPVASDVFPSGIPGQGETNPGEGEDAPSAAGGLTPDQIGTLDQILTDLGRSLGQYPETGETGRDLQNGDLEAAASGVERIADTLDLLPPQALENLAQSLAQAAQQAAEAGQEDLAQALNAAAQALQGPAPDFPAGADALDQIAEELRRLAASLAPGSAGDPSSGEPGEPGSITEGSSGAGSGSATQGQPEPLIRLEAEGGALPLEGGQEPSGLLVPGSSAGDVVVAGAPGASSGSTGGTATVNSVLTPYSLSWRWRNVVSKYFSR
jgi:hypothetical protein